MNAQTSIFRPITVGALVCALLAIGGQARAQTAPSEEAAPPTPVILAAPVAGNKTIEVFVTATADRPYVFKQADFPFSDTDAGDTLARVDIDSVPSAGTLRTSGADTAKGHQLYANPDSSATPPQVGFSRPYLPPGTGAEPDRELRQFHIRRT